MSDVETIEHALRAADRKRRCVAGFRLPKNMVSRAGAALLVIVLVDRWRPGPPGVRVFTATAFGVLVAVVVARVAWVALGRRFNAADVARFVETLDPSWDERLSTVVTAARLQADRRGSPALNAVLTADVAKTIGVRSPTRRVTFACVRPAGSWLALVALAWAGACVTPWLDVPRLVERQWRPLADLPPVVGTQIELLPHADAVTQGRSLAVVADVTGDADVVTMLVGPDLSQLRPVPMDRSYGQRFTTTLLSLQDDFVYRVTAGDAVSPPVSVRVLQTPGVTSLDLTLTYADGRPAIVRNDSDGRLRVPAGTRVGVTFRVTGPLRTASVRFGRVSRVATPDSDRRTWHAAFVVDAGADWAIELFGEPGIKGRGPAGMRVWVDGPATQAATRVVR